MLLVVVDVAGLALSLGLDDAGAGRYLFIPKQNGTGNEVSDRYQDDART